MFDKPLHIQQLKGIQAVRHASSGNLRIFSVNSLKVNY
jgi:hypothetical protein